MKYFEYEHLPEKLQEVSKPIGEMAKLINETLPEGVEKEAGLLGSHCFDKTSHI